MSDQDPVVSAEAVAAFQTLNLDEIPDNALRKGISASINLMENVNRGTVAEVIVAMALGGRVTEGWGDWDVELEDGSRIEVKSTGSIQAWPQRRPSSVTWQIPKTQGWELGENGYTENPVLERRSDFYVLAMHNGVRPDDTDEWRFFVIPTVAINETLGDQKSINERSVRRTFGIKPIDYSELSRLVLQPGSWPKPSHSGTEGQQVKPVMGGRAFPDMEC